MNGPRYEIRVLNGRYKVLDRVTREYVNGPHDSYEVAKFHRDKLNRANDRIDERRMKE